MLTIRPYMPFLERKTSFRFTSGELEGWVVSAGQERGARRRRPDHPGSSLSPLPLPPPPASCFPPGLGSLWDRFTLPHPQVLWVWVGLEVSEEKSGSAEWRSAWLLLLPKASRAYWEASC